MAKESPQQRVDAKIIKEKKAISHNSPGGEYGDPVRNDMQQGSQHPFNPPRVLFPNLKNHHSDVKEG